MTPFTGLDPQSKKSLFQTYGHRMLLALGTLIAIYSHWRFRTHANPDTVSYLDIAVKYSQGRWSEAVNDYWSPLYSWALVPFVRYFENDRTAVLKAAHLLNALLVPAVMAAAWQLVRPSLRSETDSTAVSAVRWTVLGAALMASVGIVPVKYLTPDVLGLALVLWLTARFAQELNGTPGAGRLFVTGMLAGVTYMCRSYAAPYFALLLVLTFWLRGPGVKGRVIARRAAFYLCGFLAVSSFWIAAVSRHDGRFTIGEAGKVNFFGHSLIMTPDVETAAEAHYVRGYELPYPVAFPEHYAFHLKGRLEPLHKIPLLLLRLTALNTSALLFGYYPPDFPYYWPLLSLIALGYLAFRAGGGPRAPNGNVSAFLCAAAAGGFSLFIASHVESRYAAAFLVILAAGVALRCTALPEPKKGALLSFAAALGVLFFLFPFFMAMNQMRGRPAAVAVSQAELTRHLERGPGRIATAGPSYMLALNAWLSRTQIIANIEPGGLTAEHCSEVTDKLTALRVDAVLAPSPAAACGQWSVLPGTDWYQWRLSKGKAE